MINECCAVSLDEASPNVSFHLIPKIFDIAYFRARCWVNDFSQLVLLRFVYSLLCSLLPFVSCPLFSSAAVLPNIEHIEHTLILRQIDVIWEAISIWPILSGIGSHTFRTSACASFLPCTIRVHFVHLKRAIAERSGERRKVLAWYVFTHNYNFVYRFCQHCTHW